MADLGVQLAVGQFTIMRRVVAFPDDRNLVAALFKMSVQTVDGNVKFAAQKPLYLAFGVVVMQYLLPRLMPVQKFGGLFSPKCFRFGYRLLVETLISSAIDMRAGGNLRINRINLLV